MQARRAKGYKAVHRPTRWGNPFPVEEYGREEAMRRYEEWLDKQLNDDPEFLEPLRGFDLGCFCNLSVLCHGDIILRRLYGEKNAK